MGIYVASIVLAMVNGAAMNAGVHVFFWIKIFLGYMLRSGISGSYGSLIFLRWAFFLKKAFLTHLSKFFMVSNIQNVLGVCLSWSL